MDKIPIISPPLIEDKSFKIFPLNDYFLMLNEYPELKESDLKLINTLKIKCPTGDIENPSVDVNVYIITYQYPLKQFSQDSTVFQLLSKLLKTIFIPDGVIVFKYDNDTDSYLTTHIDKRYLSNLKCEEIFNQILNNVVLKDTNCFSGAIKKFGDKSLKSIFNINEVVNGMFEYDGIPLENYAAKKNILEQIIGLGLMNPRYEFLKNAFIEMFSKNESSFDILLTKEDLEEIYFFKRIPRYLDLLRLKYDVENKIKKVKSPIDCDFLSDALNIPIGFNELFSLMLLNPDFSEGINLGDFVKIPENLYQSIIEGRCNYYILRTLSAASNIPKMRGQHISIILEAELENRKEYFCFGYGMLNQLDANTLYNTLIAVSPQRFLQNPVYQKVVNLFKYAYGSIYTPDFAVIKKLRYAIKKSDEKSQFIEIVDYGVCNQGHADRINNLLKDTINIVLNSRLYYEFVNGEDKFYIRHDNEIDFMYTKSSSVYKEGVFNPFSQVECTISNPGNCSSVAQYIFQDKIRCSRIKIPFAADLIPGFNAPDNCVKLDGTLPKCYKVLE